MPTQASLPDADSRDEMFDMANLSTRDTGLPGTVTISTPQGSHGPRIKWFSGRPGRDGPCLIVTLADPPLLIPQGLDARDVAAGREKLVASVDLNRSALLTFWNDGLSWMRQDVSAFIDGLRKLP
jgi:hypothetical protein